MPCLAPALQVQRSFGTIYRLRARRGWFFPLLSLMFATPAALCAPFWTDVFEGRWKP